MSALFEDLTARVRAGAEERARARGVALAEADGQGVRMSGKGLRRRFALDPALRWLVAGLVK